MALLKKELRHRRFPVNFAKFLRNFEQFFYRAPPGDCFQHESSAVVEEDLLCYRIFRNLESFFTEEEYFVLNYFDSFLLLFDEVSGVEWVSLWKDLELIFCNFLASYRGFSCFPLSFGQSPY